MKKYATKTLIAIIVAALLLATVIASSSAAEYEESTIWLNSNPNAPTDYAYSLAIVGDTQILVETDANSRQDDDPSNDTNYTASIYNWIVANKDAKKMQYVIGLGDITNNHTDLEWQVAKDAITKMNGVIPYSLVKGVLPHDTESTFNKYFANEEGFTSNISGYYKEGSVSSTYSTFTVGEHKYLILSLDFGADDNILAWASSILEKPEYSDYRVIINTHAYLWTDGTPCNQSNPVKSLPDHPDKDTDDARNNGDEMWDKFVSKHENIFLVLSGHFESNDIVASQEVGENGNIVTQMLVNPQGFDATSNCETGLVCMLYFSEDGNTMWVEYYSTYRDQYYKEYNQFKIDLTSMTLDEGIETKYGVIPARSYNPEKYPYALFKKTPTKVGGVEYEYTFYGVYNTLMGNSVDGAVNNYSVAYHAAREAVKDGAVILLLRDVEFADDYSYSNLHYHPGSLTIDLDGHTFTDAHTYDPGLVYAYMKQPNNQMSMTFKNGSIVVGDKSLISFGGRLGHTNCSFTTIFEDIDFSFAPGATTDVFVSKFTEYDGKMNVIFDGCRFDMANAKEGFRFVADGHESTVTITNSIIENSEFTYNVNEYGYAAAKPTELEHIAVYKKTASAPVIDGVTYSSEYTFVGYYKAFYANSTLGVSTETGAFNAIRTATNSGVEAVAALITDHEITSSESPYSNLCYNQKDCTIDLRGYTLTDSNAHSNTVFYLYLKNKTNTKSSTITVKNGSFVLGSDGIVDYNYAKNEVLGIAFENITFSWKESGANATFFIGGASRRSNYPVSFKNCVIDLENASDDLMLEQNGIIEGIDIIGTVVKNSRAEAVYTTSESDILDGNYVISKYGPIPLQAADTKIYPFVSFSKTEAVIDGFTYQYTFYQRHRSFYSNSSLSTVSGETIAASALRYGGDGVVVLLRCDYIDNSDGGYTNFCYNPANTTIDLDGHTLVDNYSTPYDIFYNYLKKMDQQVTVTVKGGSIVLNGKGLISYGFNTAAQNSTLHMIFEDMNISLGDGATTDYIIAKHTSSQNHYFVTFKNCVIDLENAPEGFQVVAQGSYKDAITVDFTDTEIINSKAITPKHNISLYTDFVYNVYIPTLTADKFLTITDVTLGDAKFGLDAVEIVNIDGASYYKISVSITPEAAAEVQILSIGVNYVYNYSNGTSDNIAHTLEWEVSIISYLSDIVTDENEVVVTLAKDMLSYIRAAYVYDNTSVMLDEIKAEIESLLGEEYDAENMPATGEAKCETDGMDAAQLLLHSVPAFIFHPEATDDGSLVYDAERYIFALDGKYKLDATVSTDENGVTYILVPLPAWATDNDIEYIVTDTEIHGCYNIYAYYEYAKTTDDTALIKLIERLCKYAESAEAYKNTNA